MLECILFILSEAAFGILKVLKCVWGDFLWLPPTARLSVGILIVLCVLLFMIYKLLNAGGKKDVK